MNDSKSNKFEIGRRSFLKSSVAAAGYYSIGGRMTVPNRWRRKLSPNEKLNLACVGCGGMGGADIDGFAGLQGEYQVNIVAMCDVDEERARGAYQAFPDATKFKDFRRMLDRKWREIDAIAVSTPDHTHAVIAMEAMQRGIHTYVQKPLTRSIWEARRLTLAARQYGVMTHMGNQGHQLDGVRRISEWVKVNRIGPVREVHCWTNRPVWPQGIQRPQDTPAIPPSLDWDLWLGPASERPYNPIYHPFNWRGWWDFGCGALGDMGCHILDPAYTSLELGYPTAVELVEQEGNNPETFPNRATVKFEFPARAEKPPVTLYWYEGVSGPPAIDGIPADAEYSEKENGSLLIGDWGIINCGTYGGNPKIFPSGEAKVEPFMPSSIGHREEFVRACKTGEPAGGNFDYAGPFTEVVLLGNLAIKAGTRIEWNAFRMESTNGVDGLEDVIRPPYRSGWQL